MKKNVITIILSLLIATAANAAIVGSVVDDDGAPIAGAIVRTFAFESPLATARRIAAGKLDRDPIARVAAGDDGAFKIETGGVPVVYLNVSAPGRAVVEMTAADGDDVGPLILASAPSLKLKVTADGKPISNAVVSVSSTWAAKTNADGTVDLPKFASAGAGIIVAHPDYAPTSTSFNSSTN